MKFQSGDIKVLFTAGAVLFLSGYLLYQDFSSTPSCCRNSVIANVLFTGGTVQKKSVSDYIWHSLLTDMQIHSHDTVKTNSDSEITISIDKGIQIELDSQTRVSFLRNRKNDIELDFKEGSIFLENNSENTRVTVSHDKNKISAGRGLFRFAVINTGLYISCIQGFAELKPAAGGRKQIFAGQTKVLSEKGIAQRNLYLDLHPVDNAHLYLKDSQSINFRWMQQEALLEVSKEKNFSNPIFFQEVDSSQIRLKMDYGIYYWRIRTEDNQVSQFHKLLVLPEEKTLIRTPEPETAFLTSQNYSTVDFLWKGNTQAEYYRLEISEDENFSRKVYDEKIFRNGISIKLPINIYYWRISAIHNHTTINITQPRYFSIEEGQESIYTSEVSEITDPNSEKEQELHVFNPAANPDIENPDFTYPPENSTIHITADRTIEFRWKPVKAATQYHIYFYQTSGRKKHQILKDTVSEAQYSIKNPVILKQGVLICKVEARFNEELLAQSNLSFKVVLNKKLTNFMHRSKNDH